MTDDASPPTLSTDPWANFCDRMKTLGPVLADSAFAQGPHDRAEGMRHLARLTTYALQWYLEFGDRDAPPAFHRYDDDIVKWGGPNADNHYLRARLDPAGTYRVTGDVHGVHQLIVSTNEGDMALGQYQVFAERHLGELTLPDGRLDLVVGGAEPEDHRGDWLPLHPDTDHLLIRIYVTDWATDAIPDLDIERIDRVTVPPQRPTIESMTETLDSAATWVEASLPFWAAYQERTRSLLDSNTLSPPSRPPGGAHDIAYGGGHWDLGDGEVLLIEFDQPDADHWSVQLYSVGLFESLDIAHRQVSLNDAQAHVDDDGRVRLVVAAEDPGAPNWLDTERRPTGMIAYRWVWARSTPAPITTVLTVADLDGALPPDHPHIDEDTRRQQLDDRRRGIARRFRR
jgi:hypothetical protein